MSVTKLMSLPLVLTLAVCLTACSDLLASLDQTSQVGEQKQVAAAVVKSEPTHPDVPAHLVACATATGLKSPAKDAKAASADAKVAALQKLSEERRACAVAIVGWYKKVQAANKKAEAAQKPAG